MQLLWKICWWLSILSMYTVISAFTKQGFFLLVYTVFECRNLKIGRGQTVLFRYLLSFFHNSPAAGSSCVPAAYMHEPPGLAPHRALESISAFQPKAGVCQESEMMPKFGFLKVWHFVLAVFPQLLGKTQAALIVLRKFYKKPSMDNFWKEIWQSNADNDCFNLPYIKMT